MSDAQSIQQRRIVPTYVNRGLTLVSGEGVYLTSEDGTRYLDLMSNYGVNIFGYQHPTITSALTSQLSKLTTLHGSFTNDIRANASMALVQRCGNWADQVYWSNSGAEANEAALKFAVLATQKKRFIVCDHGYHGKTLGALSATAGEKYKKPFEPLLWEFVQIPFNDLSALETALTDQTAGFIVEPIQGEGGIYEPASDYLARAADLCHAKGALFIIDEIQTGCGRTGTFLASQSTSAIPDIVCLGKGLAGGIPIGATIVNATIAQAIPKHIHTSTFGGNPLACAGVLATLELLDEARLTHVQQLGLTFREALNQLHSPLIREVRGRGLMLGIVVTEQRNQLMKALQDAKVLVIPAGDDVVRLLPPLVIDEAAIQIAVNAFRDCLAKLTVMPSA